MSDENKKNGNGKAKDKKLDLSDFGSLPPQFSNRFYVIPGPLISRIFFGERLFTDGEDIYHSQVAMATVDILQLRDLLNELLPETKPEQDEADEAENAKS